MEFNVHNLVKWFQLKYPKLVQAMKDADHHYSKEELNPYHLESDVWTHTMMVVLEASKNTVDHNFDKHLLIAALLHDIGKPMTRRENHEKKRVNFFNHEPTSAYLAIPVIDHIEKDFSLKLNKRLILEAIAMHTEVFKVEEPELLNRLKNNSTLALLLSRLSKSDHHGRFYEMGDRITSDMKPEITHLYYNSRQVVIFVGLPCSGKSTLVKKQTEGREGWAVLSADDIIMELGLKMGIEGYSQAWNAVDHNEVSKILQERKKNFIKQNLNVVVDMTNMSRKTRRKNLQGFPSHYMKSAYVVMTSLQNVFGRNEQRLGKVIPEEVFERMVSAFQPPLYDEFDEIQWEFN